MALTQQAQFERCCRLCAEEQEVTVMLFSREADAMLLQNKLNKYLLIEVDEDDKLPQNICITCCTKLQTVCEFIDTVHRSQELLLQRSLMLDQIATDKRNIPYIKQEVEENVCCEDGNKFTMMEVNVDPLMVLQNSDEPAAPSESDDDSEDVTYLNKGDSDKVTLKLIRKGDSTPNKSNHDNSLKQFSCDVCKRSFNTELALKNHSWSHNMLENNVDKPYKCISCPEVFNVKVDLINHLKQHKTKGLCQLCGRVFRSERTYSAHMMVHLSNKPYNCKVCGRSYSTRSLLKNHSVTHSSERPYPCSYCKKSFKRNQDLKFHINQHTGNKPYQCPFCDKSFASSGNCYSHRSRIHPERNIEAMSLRRMSQRKAKDNQSPRPIAPKPALTAVKGVFKYQCQQCHHSFMKRDNFTYHMYQHTGEKPFHCTFCTEKFVTRRGLSLHHSKAHPAKDRPLALLTKNALLK